MYFVSFPIIKNKPFAFTKFKFKFNHQIQELSSFELNGARMFSFETTGPMANSQPVVYAAKRHFSD